MHPLRIGLCQILVGLDKAKNIEVARQAVREASNRGANLVSLPECFNSPYAVDQFEAYSEKIPNVGENVNAKDHPTTCALLELAKELKIHLVGGSIPEVDGSKLFNTCIVASPSGTILAKHRKVHLFDVDLPDMKFKESTTLSTGDSLTLFDTPWGKIGIGICYDMRFAALASIMRQQGAQILIYPGAFNTKTGPAHWELLQRARAVDNQLFVATCSPARNPESKYQAWGHSSLISPWGDVLLTTDEKPEVLVSDVLDLDQITRIRAQIPISLQFRSDLYSLERWNEKKSRLSKKAKN